MLAYVALSFLTRKTMETKKVHPCSLFTTRDREGHIQSHVTLTYKVTRQGYSVGLCCVEFPDPKKHRNKKKFIAVACLQPETGKVPFKVT